jgi:hypothetical protein
MFSAAKVWGNRESSREECPKDEGFGQNLTFINRNQGVHARGSIYK